MRAIFLYMLRLELPHSHGRGSKKKKKIANNRNLNLLAEVALGFRNYFAILQFDDRISLEIRLMLIRNLIKTDEIYLTVTKIRLIRSNVKRQ